MKIKDIAFYVKDTIKSSEISIENYVSTETMKQNKLGIDIATRLPKNETRLTHFKKNDILIGNIRPYLKKIWLADREGGCSNQVLVLRAKENISPYNLYAILMQDSFFDYAMLSSKGTRMPVGSPECIIEFPFDDNIIKTDSIGSLFKSILYKIEINNSINNNLALMAKDIYIHLFYGKKENGSINDILIESKKSKIQVKQAKNSNGKYPFFTSGQSIYNWEKPLVNGRFCYLNTGGNADIKFYVGESAYSTDTWCISAKNDLTDYLYLLLNLNKEEIELQMFQGTGLKHLQKDLFKSKRIYIPDSKETIKFNELVKPIFTKISENKRENKKLEELRDWVLPILMNRQLVIE